MYSFIFEKYKYVYGMLVIIEKSTELAELEIYHKNGFKKAEKTSNRNFYIANLQFPFY